MEKQWSKGVGNDICIHSVFLSLLSTLSLHGYTYFPLFSLLPLSYMSVNALIHTFAPHVSTYSTCFWFIKFKFSPALHRRCYKYVHSIEAYYCPFMFLCYFFLYLLSLLLTISLSIYHFHYHFYSPYLYGYFHPLILTFCFHRHLYMSLSLSPLSYLYYPWLDLFCCYFHSLILFLFCLGHRLIYHLLLISPTYLATIAVCHLHLLTSFMLLSHSTITNYYFYVYPPQDNQCHFPNLITNSSTYSTHVTKFYQQKLHYKPPPPAHTHLFPVTNQPHLLPLNTHPVAHLGDPLALAWRSSTREQGNKLVDVLHLKVLITLHW